MNLSPTGRLVLLATSLCLFGCNASNEKRGGKVPKVMVAVVQSKDATDTRRYVGRFHSYHRITIRATASGYLESVRITEGQQVKKDDLLFEVVPVLFRSKLDAESAVLAVERAQLELDYFKKLYVNNVVAFSENQLPQLEAKLSKAKAKAETAKAELNLAKVRAPFDGMVSHLTQQEGGFVQKSEIVTTLSDDSQIWVYFDVSEARYFEYMSTNQYQHKDQLKIELVLADGKTFNQLGKSITVAADFNNKTGSIPFRAEFPNPDHLLRHGQTGTVLVSWVQKDAIVIPRQAMFALGEQPHVYVVDENDVVHQRPIVVENELGDQLVVKTGVGVGDKIVVGAKSIHDGQKVEY